MDATNKSSPNNWYETFLYFLLIWYKIISKELNKIVDLTQHTQIWKREQSLSIAMSNYAYSGYQNFSMLVISIFCSLTFFPFTSFTDWKETRARVKSKKENFISSLTQSPPPFHVYYKLFHFNHSIQSQEQQKEYDVFLILCLTSLDVQQPFY